ncbi:MULTISPECIES: hypothetical protein [Lachnospiraceae]|uniref:Uncharacterized protein n=1 Tax=Hungatella hominis TaxID=2763050 RepID=A0ABR7HEQ3_9FIRM|nr:MULTISPECIES: hypothetical protein [Clostridia]MBC5711679.1 hypothetical protein [Hungatella hominis]
MNKENVNQSTVDIFCEKKELEKSCLVNAISKVPWLQKFKLVGDETQESPDFVLERNNKYIGIEHFHIDMLYVDKKKHTGLARYTYNDLKALYKKYHGKAEKNTFESQDAKDASLELEKILNELIDIQNMFDYTFFIKEWDRIFTKHYNKRYEYKKDKNLEKLGFLIEIRRYFKFPYMCISNNNNTRLDSKNIPITKDIAEYLNKFGEGVDFFIVVVKGLLDDSVSVEFYDKDKPPIAKFDNFEFEKIPGKFQINVEQ